MKGREDRPVRGSGDRGILSQIIYFGVVTDIQDPDELGRVKVKFPAFDEDVESVWLRMIHPFASKEFGHWFMPEIDDEVLVLRGGEDAFGSMVVLGSLYNAVAKPPNTEITGNKLERSEIKTRTGHQLIFDEASGGEKITIVTGDGSHTVILDQSGQGEITVESGCKVNVTGGADITIDAGMAKVAINAGSVEIKSSAGEVKIESTAGVTLKGNAPVTVESTAVLNLKGSMVNIG